LLLVFGGPFERMCHGWLSPFAKHYAKTPPEHPAAAEPKSPSEQIKPVP
jgi:hypothetical protein